jgi:hypothetical protein
MRFPAQRKVADATVPSVNATTPPDVATAPEDEHLGATEDQMADTPAPEGEDYKDEPRQG